MDNIPQMKVIARIESDFPTKFGIPRQSGLIPELTARVVFEPEYRAAEALRGIEGFSHLWLLWLFSENIREGWSPTVRPPRLGGNERMGVFATRSPFRPNPIGLSSVKIERLEKDEKRGVTLIVSGADLMDGTPILDIKPYIPLTDSHPEAKGGFTDKTAGQRLEVEFPPELLAQVDEKHRDALFKVLSGDPRPHYQNDPRRVYGFSFAGYEIRFTVEGDRLTVKEIIKYL